MTGDILQPIENNTKKTPCVRFTKEPTITATEDEVTSSSTEALPANQRHISARTCARNELQSKMLLVRFTKNNNNHKHCRASYFSSEKC
eukprot:39281-Ditylum_brightwellii.AAC.1